MSTTSPDLFDDLFSDDTTRHLLDVIVCNRKIPVTIDGLTNLTDTPKSEVDSTIDFLLDIDLIEQSHDGTMVRLNLDEPQGKHLYQIYHHLHDHVSDIHNHSPPRQDEELAHTGSPFNCLLKHDDTRSILAQFLIYETIPLNTNSFLKLTTVARPDITSSIEFLLDIDLIESDSNTDGYILADTELTHHLAEFHTYLQDHAQTIKNTTHNPYN